MIGLLQEVGMCRNDMGGRAYRSAPILGNDKNLSGLPASRMPVAKIRGYEALPMVLDPTREPPSVCPEPRTARARRDIGAGIP